jgi:hypothetical protein
MRQRAHARSLPRGGPRRPRRVKLGGMLALLLATLFPWARAQTPATPHSPDHPTAEQAGAIPIFHAQSQLVLVDVLARDLKTGLPIGDLKREDFRVFDNRREVPIVTFGSGARFGVRPIALWFVVICNEQGKGEHGRDASGSFSGDEPLFLSALDDLDRNDRAGVAHWCDNGEAALDLDPTDDHDALIARLTETLRPIEFEVHSSDFRRGELTLQRLLRMLLDQAHHSNPQPLPVLLFLHTDVTGMPRHEANALVDELLETSGFAFGIKNASDQDYPRGRIFGEQSSVLHYMAAQTGGEYFSVPREAYAETLKGILRQLHARYELGFKPPAIDDKRHKLKVEFAGAARDRRKSARLRYRPEYIPASK